MQRKDIITTTIIAVIAVIAAVVITNSIMGDPNEMSKQYNSIVPISAELGTPDTEIFNEKAINPTVEVYVGDCPDTNLNGIADECGSGEIIDDSNTNTPEETPAPDENNNEEQNDNNQENVSEENFEQN